MEPLKVREHPEAKVQKSIVNMLLIKGWFVKRMVGNAFQFGIPDLFACHYRYGQRWIEVKLPGMKGSKFTAAQLEDFPKLCANGSGVWVLTGDSDTEYQKLFAPPNWYMYLNLMKG